ncbi:helix-turn-helix domain-containing protein [Enterococcus faecalis]|uniref:helix-turn-helix domain-containing protein n=1 Tax=Enterococcus TaxID=1350 RepID=UPI001A0184CC|nr:helix-turn-helix transcriptional regulator [Enterococcus faecalis]EGO5178532.1 helix-turn-helix transcriptional regulator [Enterococcus faecalis]EGO8007353.1 helix-turn-helix transcriptional regulator [Enterococcus faecalis]EHB6421396.1 helix-turn-helix transcriptional regulator [Enterococcus faecalis]EIA1504033.1 helix-turn-helix transcriptional regulator [Enterococcus faecalis]EKN1401015.1 helix-turn-helix transcriptional regulator [Enterococcus faecalis]
MDLYEKIKLLASEKKMSIRQLEEALGFGNGVINRWRKNTPGSDKLKKVADYFDVSTDYLLGRTNTPSLKSVDKNQMTVEEALASVMSSDGKPLTENDREILAGIIEAYLEKKNK